MAIDLDDTLYPERAFVFSGYRAVGEHVRSKWHVDILPRLTERFLRGERGDLFTPSLKEANCYSGEGQVLELVRIYREHIPALQPFDDVPAALDLLYAKVPLCIISDGWAAVQRRKLAALALERYFDAVVITDEKGREYWKPHRWGYEQAAHRLGCAAEQLVYIGDNPLKDFRTPRLLGMTTIRVRRPDTFHAAVEPAPGFEADVEVPTFAQAVAQILPRLKDGVR